LGPGILECQNGHPDVTAAIDDRGWCLLAAAVDFFDKQLPKHIPESPGIREMNPGTK
jgi:hypothetical protein